MNILGGFIGILSVILLIVMITIYIVSGISYDRNCGGYLKRAADANTIELAQKELEKAISYMEKENLTSGYTSVLYQTPDEDIGFWYTNIKSSMNELKNLDSNATALEKSNMLMKLRETLLDNGKGGGTHITQPDGISIYPYNTLFSVLTWLSFIGVALLCFIIDDLWF